MIVINIRVQVFKSEAQDWTQQMSTKQRLFVSINLLTYFQKRKYSFRADLVNELQRTRKPLAVNLLITKLLTSTSG